MPINLTLILYLGPSLTRGYFYSKMLAAEEVLVTYDYSELCFGKGTDLSYKPEVAEGTIR